MSPYRAMTKARHPFEVFTLFLAFVSGLPLLFGEAKPGSIVEALGPVAENIWAGLLSVGAGVALYGVWMRNRVNGILVEQVGLVGIGMALLYYAAVIGVVQGFPGILPIAIIGGFGASCLWRWVQLEKMIREARRLADQNQHRRDLDEGLEGS